MKVLVSAPCRLHFGLLHVPTAGSSASAFGGLGAMLESPRVEVMIELADTLTTHGSLAERAMKFAEMIGLRRGLYQPYPFRITADGPPEHIGLGVGTALGMAIARGILMMIGGHERGDFEYCAQLADRGKRSRIGIHGFEKGGFRYDGGQHPDSPYLFPYRKYDFPEEWYFVLLTPSHHAEWSGERESSAFDRSRHAHDADSLTRQLQSIIDNEIVPALQTHEFERFARGLGEYNRLAGIPFQQEQDGPYGQSSSAIIARLQAMKLFGIGQSSWGPTVFALVNNTITEMAIRHAFKDDDITIRVSGVDPRGVSSFRNDSE